MIQKILSLMQHQVIIYQAMANQPRTIQELMWISTKLKTSVIQENTFYNDASQWLPTLCQRDWVNTLRPDKMGVIFQTTFLNAFTQMKMYGFWLRFHWRFNQKCLSFGSDNGLAAVRWQAIFLINDGLVHWRIYASLGLNELTPLRINNPLIHHSKINIHGLVQERCNSVANTLELRLSCTNPSICSDHTFLNKPTQKTDNTHTAQ